MHHEQNLLLAVYVGDGHGYAAACAGHVWTTSLDQMLLRFAGPCWPDSGCLLQQVHLPQLMPQLSSILFPMDVQAVVQPHQAPKQHTYTAAADGSAVAGGRRHGRDNQPSTQCAAAHHSTSSLLIVTAHAGPDSSGLVITLQLTVGLQQETNANGQQQQQKMQVEVVNCWNESCMQQPNMVAIQSCTAR